ncbi:hypothetical protein DEEACLCL_00137 [Salmonella phage CRW-SP2]|nr:hypothetical protein DEEACLCL_00137 [Salmonella phage CRW-SP2]
MSKERVYQQLKAQEYLPGSIRYRIGAFNENVNKMDTIRFATTDGKAYVIEYHTFTEKSKTFSDVFDIIEIDLDDQLIKG